MRELLVLAFLYSFLLVWPCFCHGFFVACLYLCRPINNHQRKSLVTRLIFCVCANNLNLVILSYFLKIYIEKLDIATEIGLYLAYQLSLVRLGARVSVIVAVTQELVSTPSCFVFYREASLARYNPLGTSTEFTQYGHFYF